MLGQDVADAEVAGPMNKFLDSIRLPLLITGMMVVFIAERYFAAEKYHELALGIGAALVAISALVCLLRSRLAAGVGLKAESRSWLYMLAWHALIFIGICIYFAYRAQLGQAPKPETALQKLLLGGYLIAIIIGIATGIGTEFAHRHSGQGFLADSKRVARTSVSWMLIGMLLCILGAVNYSTAKRDRTFDLSYLKSTEPGTSSVNMVKSLTDKMEVILFFPSDNEVLPFVEKYVRQLAAQSPQVEVSVIDVDLNPAAAERHKVSRNGIIMLGKGEQQRERIEVKMTLRAARDTLRKLDGEFQKAFLKINASKKVAYFTRGHGEMTWSAEDPAGFRSLRFVERLMRAQQYTVKNFGVSDGSANEVPDDATLVVIAGPTGPFMKEEVEALKRFTQRGGKLLVLLDVSSGELDTAAFIEKKSDPLVDWLDSVGIEFKPDVLANDRNFVSVRKAAADKWFLFSNIFTSHESVANLAKNEERVPVLLFQSGYLVVNKKDPWKTNETIRVLKDTFVDLNRNYQFDEANERRETYVVGAAATFDTGNKNGDLPIESKVLVLADATAMSDGIIASGVPGNQVLIADGLRWLVDETKYSGETVSEEDVKIRHTKKEDGLLFYGTIFGMPALILIAGFVATRRRKGEARA
jgi:hypothetical protein